MTLPSIFHVAAGSPPWFLAAVKLGLILHISAGSVAILSGAAALSVRKGERLHRAFGTAFFLSMLVTAAMATYLAVLIPQRSNVLGGIFAFYLVATAWVTVRRKEGSVGLFENVALFVALGCAAAYVIFGFQAANSPMGKLDGFPVAIYFGTGCMVALAAALDFKVILRGGIFGAQRIARHHWRMCVALFFATGSFFIGQQKVMPAFMHGSPILYVLGIAPLVLMIFWLIRVRLTNSYNHAAVAN